MRILFVGSFADPWSTHHSLVEELRKKNYEVVKFDFRNLALNNIRLKNRLYSVIFKEYFETFFMYRLYFPDKLRDIKFYIFGNWRMNKNLLNIVKNSNFDLVFLAKADTVNYNLIPIFNNFSKTWYFFMDPLNISHEIRGHKYAKLCNWNSATTKAMNTLYKKVSDNSYYILEGFDENIFKPGEENKQKEIDVIFVGTRNSLREKYIKYLRKNKIDVNVHGPRWKNKPIYLENLAKKYKISKIILNFTKKDSGFSNRVFYAMGTGSFLLSKYCSDLPRLFKKGIHMDWFKSPEECLKLIKFYLENDEIREKIAQEGKKYALENFTWKKSVEKIFKILNNKKV
jgi:glycosyltransferase involved in cell wall biosynthesis